jgi:hypothetical protein
MNNPVYISDSLGTNFLAYLMQIRDGNKYGSGIQDGNKYGSGIQNRKFRIRDPSYTGTSRIRNSFVPIIDFF